MLNSVPLAWTPFLITIVRLGILRLPAGAGIKKGPAWWPSLLHPQSYWVPFWMNSIL
ncbi:hypothetical protein LH427_12630 [Laribacter hongkongensis]|nr:hypothetical protein [Laribacter hongkongensis]